MSASFATTLDLRQIAPPARHPLIFNSFAALLPGQTLELINDHDPQPLNAQFQMRSPGLFSWSYLEQGPQVWRVQIGKSAGAASAASGSCCSGGACCG
ncbi:DUF2249 domain-containing protein [Rhodoferax sp. UBA5149]|uniref:DUF2249 domain-containing protein n=1 Tax=Rhodoferax sp. UBA5149 TaxID=1947379 RepID=UPI0025DDF0E4|nr:DUF2249 domain-containing protein [Rhodoferax sp. UBA5149]